MADVLTLTDATAFQGNVSTDGDAWATDERPTNFRQKILQLDPNGMTPLTAITAFGRSEKTDDAQFNWYEKNLPIQGGAAAIYADEGLATPYTGPATKGTIVFAKVASDVVGHFRRGQQALLRVGYETAKNKVGKVVVVISAGASSVVGVQLAEADASSHLADCDYINVCGSQNQEGSTTPTIIGYKPEKKYNFTQIFRTPFQITRTARQTRLRTRDPWQSVRQEALMLHGLDIERALMWSERDEITTGDEPERTTRGILKWISNDAPQNLVSFYASTETDFVGKAWVDVGYEFVDRYLEHLFLYARNPLGICGTGFLRGINAVARANGHINIVPGTTSFGMKVVRWDTPYGSVTFKTNPMFAFNEQDRWSCLFVSPEYMIPRTIQDTVLLNENGEQIHDMTGYDGSREEYLTELGLELHHAKAFGFWSGVGLNHSLYVP